MIGRSKYLWLREAKATVSTMMNSRLGPWDNPNSTDVEHLLTTARLVNSDARVVFAMLFGSWFGEWDRTDNFLRSVLATPSYGLAAVWSGWPQWFLHPMGLGETAGYCAQLTQGNGGLYEYTDNSGPPDNNRLRFVHIALMGDPSLRLHPVAPVTQLTAQAIGSSVTLNWQAPANETVAGYHVYRGQSLNGPFTLLTTGAVEGVTTMSYTDFNAPSGAIYMVRTTKLESTNSGSYYNLGEGLFVTSDPGGSSEQTWFDDALPIGASSGGTGGDAWTWVTSTFALLPPTPTQTQTAHPHREPVRNQSRL